MLKIEYLFLATLHGMWDLSSPSRDQLLPHEVAAQCLNQWTAREVP